MRRFFLSVSCLAFVALLSFLHVQSALAQIKYGVLFESFTNDNQPCPAPMRAGFDADVLSTASKNGVIHINHHIGNFQDVMAQAATGCNQTLSDLDGTDPNEPVFISAVNRISFAAGQYSRLSGSGSEWDPVVDNEKSTARSVDFKIVSLTLDKSTIPYVFTATLDVTTRTSIAGPVGIRYAVLQDGISNKLCENNTVINNDVVRWITYKDSAIAIDGQSIGTTKRVVWTQRFKKSTDPNFKPADMKFVAFIVEGGTSNPHVTTAALIRKDLDTLQAPAGTLAVNDIDLDGKTFTVGNTVPINIIESNIASVDVSYSLDNGQNWRLISTGSAPVVNWTIPDSETTQGKIQFQQTGGSLIATEKGTFTIKAPAHILSVLTPKSGDKDTLGLAMDITWMTKGVNKVDIQYSSDGGSKWVDVVKDYVGAQPYKWKPFGAVTDQAVIQIIPKDVTDISPAQSGVFHILQGTVGAVADQSAAPFSGLQVYPNPATNGIETRIRFTNTTSDALTVTLFDVLGRSVGQASTFFIPIGAADLGLGKLILASGSYIVRISDNKGFVISQVFKIR